MKFKIGDVVTGIDNRSNWIGIVGDWDDCSRKDDKNWPSGYARTHGVFLTAVKYKTHSYLGNEWAHTETWNRTVDTKLHPDADNLWAEYCAWRLTNAE